MVEKLKNMTIDIKVGTMVMIIFVGLIAFGLWEIRNIILVILTSVVIAAFMESAAKGWKKLKVPRVVAVPITYLLVLGAIVGLLSAFFPVFLQEIVEILQRIPGDSTIANLLGNVGTGSGFSGIKDVTSGDLATVLGNLSNQFSDLSSGGFVQSAISVFGGVVNFILVIVISFYLSMREHGVEDFLRMVTPIKYENYVVGLWQRTEEKIGLWLRGQMLLAVLLAVLTYLGLSIIGVDYALILALVAAVFGLVPFGIVLATVPALIIAYIGGGVKIALITLGLYVILQQFENYLFQPLIIKKVTGVPSLAVILSVVIGVKLLGFIGLILAIPLAVVVLEIISDFEKKKAKELKKNPGPVLET